MDMIATREAYGKKLVEIGKNNDKLVVMDADLSGSTKTSLFAKEFPDRFFNMGIAEQNMYGAAAGLAAVGKVVCASTFAMFATGRAFEVIRNSIGASNLNVKVCVTHSGITVGEDGASHQTFEDIALMRTIPTMRVVCPGDAISAGKLVQNAIDLEGPVYVRLGRSKIPVIYGDEDTFEIGKAKVLKKGKDITFIATGIMVNEMLKADEELEKLGVSCTLIDMHTIKPLDIDTILNESENTKGIVTCEEHSIIGGLFSAVSESLAPYGNKKIRAVAQMDTYGESGKPDLLREKYGLTSEHIVKEALAIINTDK